VVVPDWIWFIFIFAFGCCIGSFLNVVIYRLPRDKSLIRPPSACPACGKHIRFYDNIPLISWLVLGRKCRYCKAPISPRYFIVELLTGVLFTGLFILYFRSDARPGMVPFSQGGWFIYLLHIILLGAFIAASAVDLELWVIPVSICWFVTAAGLIGSAAGPFVIDPDAIREHFLLPTTSAVLFREVTIASLAAGAAIGLGISLLLLEVMIQTMRKLNRTPSQRRQAASGSTTIGWRCARK
jgi:leader peptidase (prepilin peptidase)/N-methyltransferase